MKKYIYILLLLASCDFLEVEPEGLPVEDEFYTNINELQLGLNAVYDVLANGDFQVSYAIIGEGASDNVTAVDLQRESLNARFIRLEVDPETDIIEDFWEQNYLGIYRANWVIEKSKRVRDFDDREGGGSSRVMRQVIGQAKFLRAFFYFNLVRTYGDVPIKSTVLSLNGSDDNFTSPRSPKSEVYQLIEKDLREASIALLASTAVSEALSGIQPTELGKVSARAALSMLMKVLVYQAEPGLPSQKWNQALEMGEYLVDENGGFSYLDLLNFDGLYEGDLDELERIKNDMLFSNMDGDTFLQHVVKFTDHNDLSMGYTSINSVESEFHPGSYIFEVAHTNLAGSAVNVESKLYNGSRRFEAQNLFQPISEFYEAFNTHLRLRYSVVSSGESVKDGNTFGNPPFPEKTAAYKWYTLNNEDSRNRNFRIMRFAEVVLFYAEVLNETGNQLGAAEQINKLRARDRNIKNEELGSDDRFDGDGVSDLIVQNYLETRKAIRLERKIELLLEFDRYWDMRRYENTEELYEDFNEDVGENYKVNYRVGISELMPIPQRDIDASSGVIIQNPGY